MGRNPRYKATLCVYPSDAKIAVKSKVNKNDVSCFTAKIRMIVIASPVTKGSAHAGGDYGSQVRPDRVKKFS